MSFRDEINNVKEKAEKAKPKINYYTDEEVYDFLIKKMYKSLIKDPIKKYFEENPSSNSYSNEKDFGFQIRVDEDDFINYKDGSSIYYSDRSIGYDGEPDTYYVGFKPLYVYEHSEWRPLKNKKISLTPLGTRVINDLKAKATKDEIEVDIKAVYTCDYRTITDKYKTSVIYPKLGEWFSGKSPTDWHCHAFGNVRIIVNFN